MSDSPPGQDIAQREEFRGPSAPKAQPAALASWLVALAGNPNSGKTTLFNALTGLRAKVGNYSGVTVERKEGRMKGAPPGLPVKVLDLPGSYSLSPRSLDERISRDVLFHRLDEVPEPDLVVVVVDASNLERNLYYATQIIELGYRTAVALNMIDVAEENGHQIDAKKLAGLLGVPVFPMTARNGEGVEALRQRIVQSAQDRVAFSAPSTFCKLPAALASELESVMSRTGDFKFNGRAGFMAEATLVLTDESALTWNGYPESLRETVQAARRRVEAAGIDWRSAAIESRYDRAAEIYREVVTETRREGESFSDRLDRVLTHKFWGIVIFVALMVMMFQSIFTFAQIPMDLIKDLVGRLADGMNSVLGQGDLNSLIGNGVIKGVGAVVVFLPQICLLFLFISILEDTGYMARAAFLMDRLMSRVGLHGKSFIPMLSSFACAIPGIMATRTIESPKDRLVTILVAPLMSCSARLPVYTLLIAACIPNVRVLGILTLPGLTMLTMYLLGIIVALVMAWIFKKTLLKAETPLLIMELPPYKRPLAKVVLRHMWDRSKLFLRRAGTVILGINILLWFLATYPRDSKTAAAFSERRAQLVEQFSGTPSSPEKVAEIIRQHRQVEADQTASADTNHFALINGLNALDNQEAGANLRNSFAGRMAHVIEPLIAPLGFDWKMGIGIVASFAAREVFVSTMSVVYNVGQSADKEDSGSGLAETMRGQRREDGAMVYTPLVGVTLMVFYVFAMQCASTVAVVRRETNSWRWPVFQWFYMGVLAWVLAFVTYHGGHLLGFR